MCIYRLEQIKPNLVFKWFRIRIKKCLGEGTLMAEITRDQMKSDRKRPILASNYILEVAEMNNDNSDAV